MTVTRRLSGRLVPEPHPSSPYACRSLRSSPFPPPLGLANDALKAYRVIPLAYQRRCAGRGLERRCAGRGWSGAACKSSSSTKLSTSSLPLRNAWCPGGPYSLWIHRGPFGAPSSGGLPAGCCCCCCRGLRSPTTHPASRLGSPATGEGGTACHQQVPCLLLLSFFKKTAKTG